MPVDADHFIVDEPTPVLKLTSYSKRDDATDADWSALVDTLKKAAAPDAVAVFVFMGAGAAARRSASVASLSTHVAATAVLGVLCLAAIFVRDRAFVTSLLGSRRRSKAE